MNVWTKAFLVALRIAVGWHFLYEGLWKIDSDTGAAAYSTSRFTLQAATGRLRDCFERGAPESLKLDTALERVDAWHDEIVRAFAARKALAEDQKARLAHLRDRVKLSAAEFVRGEIPPDGVVNFDWTYLHEEVLKIAAEQESERFTSLSFLQTSAGPLRGLFRSLVADMDGVERLTPASAQARIDARHREILEHFSRAGKPFTPDQRTRLATARDAIKASVAAALAGPAFRERREDYQAVRTRVRGDGARLDAPFSRERLDADRKNLDVIAAELLAVVNEPVLELAVQAQAIATPDQLASGPLPRPPDGAEWIDGAVKWSLTLIGACLVAGLFTPAAALAAAGQLAMFYLASPPWPGLPAATMGGHYLYVDRNLVELIAALVIATSATGRWAGLDAYVHRFLAARSGRSRLPELKRSLP